MAEAGEEEKRIEEKKDETVESKTDFDDASKKKRTADRQITKDDREDDDDDDDDGDAKLNQPFQKASEEVLSKRKILKVKRPAASSNPSSSNPFAATKLTALDSKDSESGTKVFGGGSSFSGFGGFGTSTSSTSGGFGSSSGGGFGSAFSSSSGFGSTASSSGGGFGAKASSSTDGDSPKASSSLFGNSSGSAGFSFGFAKTSTTKSTESAAPAAVTLPENVILTTGEEDEIKMHEVRCKSYKLVAQEETEEVTEEPKESANPSVKPSSNFENMNQESSKSAEEKGDEEKKGPQHRWQEIGTGPLKLLRSTDHPDKFRMVQRQESSKHGPAHKVILNVPLWKEATCTKLSEKQLRLTTPGSGESCTFTLKFSEPSETLAFSSRFKDVCKSAKSCFQPSS